MFYLYKMAGGTNVGTSFRSLIRSIRLNPAPSGCCDGCGTPLPDAIGGDKGPPSATPSSPYRNSSVVWPAFVLP